MSAGFGAEFFSMAGGVALRLVGADPSAGAGVDAVLGTLAIRTDDGSLWQKTDAADTDWTDRTLGSGDVVGPAGATDNALARYDAETGKRLQNSVITASDLGSLTGIKNISMSGGIGMLTGEGITLDNDVSGSTTISATGTNAITMAAIVNVQGITGARTWKVDLSGDGQEYLYSPLANCVDLIVSGAPNYRFDLTFNQSYLPLLVSGNLSILAGDLNIAAGQTIVGAGALDIITGAGDLTLNPTLDIVFAADVFMGGHNLSLNTGDVITLDNDGAGTTAISATGTNAITMGAIVNVQGVTGALGYMLDLSNNSAAGASGEHIRSSADLALDYHSGGTHNFYLDTARGVTLAGGSMFLAEQAAAIADAAAYGQHWVKNVAPNEAWFTDDTGVDHPLSHTAYGEIYLHDGSTPQTLTDDVTYYKLTGFTTNGLSHDTTNSESNDHVQVTNAGIYLVSFHCSFSGDPNQTYELEIFSGQSGSQAERQNIAAERKLGAGGDVGSASCKGLLSLAAGDLVELHAKSTSGAGNDITPHMLTLTVVRI